MNVYVESSIVYTYVSFSNGKGCDHHLLATFACVLKPSWLKPIWPYSLLNKGGGLCSIGVSVSVLAGLTHASASTTIYANAHSYEALVETCPRDGSFPAGSLALIGNGALLLTTASACATTTSGISAGESTLCGWRLADMVSYSKSILLRLTYLQS